MSVKEKAELNSTEIQFVCDLVREEAAIVLDLSKAYLIHARLEPLARSNGFDSLQELVASMMAKTSGFGLRKDVVDAMTTNETSFFRDFHPFEALRNHVLPDIIEKRRATQSLNIWCAASSSGQEPYSIAMVLRDGFPELRDWSVNFIATDISLEMIERASEGRYSQIEVNRGLPAPLLIKHFKQDGAMWELREEVRAMVDFRELNLIKPWPSMPQMDLVFIRNVLIYFDAQTKKDIFNKFRRVLRPDGYLFLGTAETTLNLDEQFERKTFDKATCYTLNGK